MRVLVQTVKRDLQALRAEASVDPALKGLRKHLEQFFGVIRALIRQHASPRQLALAVFLGCVVGTTPLFGAHLILCAGLGILLRLNIPLMYLAAHVSIPPLIPILGWASVQVGSQLLGQSIPSIHPDALTESIWPLFEAWMLGAIPVGSAIGSVGAGVTYLIARKYAKKATEDSFLKLVELVGGGFSQFGKWVEGSTRGKMSMDPVYRQVLDLVPASAHMVDIGGGEGLLSLLHLARGHPEATATVFDWDEERMERGRTVARSLGLPVTYRQVDVFKRSEFPKSDAITCIDVLHYAPPEVQQQLVDSLTKALVPNGRLLIRDMDGDHKLRTLATLIQEKVSLSVQRTKAGGLFPRSGSSLTHQLQTSGLAVIRKPSWGKTPFSNCLWFASHNKSHSS
jgi:uncharacterized protein (DUF2062 family)/2-polyprenyl-3-methyl-5-hydroxy-6-metoxy-1,4-benzoquinol methylase